MPKIAYLSYFVANLAPRTMMFCLLLVLTRVMPIDDYGRFVLVLTTGEFFDMSLGSWVRIYALRSEAAIGLLRPVRFGRILMLTFATTILSVLGAAATALSQSQALAFASAVIAYVLSFTLLRLALTILQIRRMHLVFAVVETLRGIGALGLTSLAAIVIGPSFLNASLGLAVATCAAATIGILFAVRGALPPRLARTGFLAAILYGLPIVLTAAMSHSLGLIDRFAVNVMIGPDAVAILAAAYAFSRQPIDLFLGPLNTYAFPQLVSIYERFGKVETGDAQSGLLVTFTMVGGGISIAVMLLAGPLLTTFLPIEYRHEGIRIVPWLTIGAFFLTAKVFIFDNVFHLAKKTWVLPLAMLGPALCGLVLCIMLIPVAGLVGASIAFAVAGIAACLVSAALSFRIIRMELPWGQFLRIVCAMGIASVGLLLVRALIQSPSSIIQLVLPSLVFFAVYTAVLAVLGLSMRHALVTPWAPAGSRRKSTALDAALVQP